LRSHTNDPAVFFEQIDYLSLHLQLECWVAASVVGKEVEKVPLRHECNEFAVRREMREVRYHYELIADLHTEFADFLVRPPEKVVEYAELINQLKRGGVDRVAAKVAQEIRMLFQQHNIDPGTGQQQAKHHSCRTTAGNAALRSHSSPFER